MHKQATMAGVVGSFLGMCNPLLDVSAEVDQAFLDKYGVGARGCCRRGWTGLEPARCAAPHFLAWPSSANLIKRHVFASPQLKANDQILAEEKHLPMYQVIAAPDHLARRAPRAASSGESGADPYLSF